MFRVVDTGFQMTFANGLEASVMFGSRNYCTRRFTPDSTDGDLRCDDAELAVFRRHEVLFADGVDCHNTGWLSPDIVAKCIACVADMPADISRNDCIKQLESIIFSHSGEKHETPINSI